MAGRYGSESFVTEPDATPVSHDVDGASKRAGHGLSSHILPTSATMIGVCMTVLSIGHLGPSGELRLLVDKLMAVAALVFLVSALLSFMAMRSRRVESRHEARAELIFISGLGMLAMAAVVLAFAIT